MNSYVKRTERNDVMVYTYTPAFLELFRDRCSKIIPPDLVGRTDVLKAQPKEVNFVKSIDQKNVPHKAENSYKPISAPFSCRKKLEILTSREEHLRNIRSCINKIAEENKDRLIESIQQHLGNLINAFTKDSGGDASKEEQFKNEGFGELSSFIVDQSSKNLNPGIIALVCKNVYERVSVILKLVMAEIKKELDIDVSKISDDDLLEKVKDKKSKLMKFIYELYVLKLVSYDTIVDYLSYLFDKGDELSLFCCCQLMILILDFHSSKRMILDAKDKIKLSPISTKLKSLTIKEGRLKFKIQDTLTYLTRI